MSQVGVNYNMRYMILKWNQQTLKWDQIFYTHEFNDFERMAEKYPMPEYRHLIDILYLQSHKIMEQVKAFRKAKNL